MNKSWARLSLFCVAIAGAALGLAGCGGAPEPAPAAAPTAPAEDAHEHDQGEHEDDAHNHESGHGHHHEAPHGGTLVMLGDHIGHLELLYDAETGVLTAYALDGHAEHPVRLTHAEVVIEVIEDATGPALQIPLQAVASPLTGETVGDSSEFRAEVKDLANRPQFKGRTPALHFRGVDCPPTEFAFPEGNES